ncbi:FeS assembly protein SufD [Methylocella tundrae]|uniref:FeS assembly protein SufD n=1 Tax=Methylocella tundrae TaxID=227605 RepID=A0A8B6MCR7_METTU|nr:Fe-S cluster assembly protein SufD [Methylocella tundrae]VTZ52119.1 FeS assembly protein SufD [Methylocella tundrae]
MSAQITAARTSAETALAETFDAAVSKLPGGADVKKLREAAFSAFYTAGLPHRRIEAWHYTDLRALMRAALPLAAPPSAAAIAALRDELSKSAPAQRLVIVDGVFVPELSDPLPAGVFVRSLAAALSEGRPEMIALIASQDFGGTDTIVSLNAALMQDGVVIEVEPGVALAAPIRLVYATALSEPSARYSRSAVVVGAGASVHIAEESLGEGARTGQTNGCLIVSVADDAKFQHTAMMTGMAPASLRIESLIARIGARAKFDSFALITGAGVVRRQIFARFEGDGAEGSLRGVSLLRGRQHADTTLLVEHLAPGCTGRQTFKYVLDEEATGVFQGKINVEKDAQKTDGRMLSKALLLSDNVAMNNKPELEIFADDVACGHGATCGGLNDDQLFYLQARGLPFAEAEALLLEAFAADLLDEFDDEELATPFRAEIARWLSARGEKA